MVAFSYFEFKEPYNTVIYITPEIAEAWLTGCNSHNRKIVESHVKRLADDMREDRWRLTHQGIAFSTNRVLLDGQHRLWAVVLSEKTVPMRVYFNEPAESMAVIDSVRPRTNDEIISLTGGLGTVTRRDLATLRAMLAGLGTYERMTPGREAELLAKHQRAVAFATEILPQSRFRSVATGVTRGVLARAFYSADHAKLRRFADVLQTGFGSEETDAPIMLLFKYLVEFGNGKGGRPELRERYAKTERALSAYLCGERITRLFSASAELFPLPNDKDEEKAA